MESCPYEMQYHYHLQGFIYSLLERSRYHHIHNKEGYKFFCFSNIFPAKDLIKNDMRSLIISSPNSDFISYLDEILLHRSNNEIRVGRMRFKIDYFDKLDVRLPSSTPFALITGTPITIRIPRDRYNGCGFEPKGNYQYVYWRNDHPIDLFVSQIENNLIKKYKEYFGLDNDKNVTESSSVSRETPHLFLFQKFKFKKQISFRVLMKGLDQVIIGILWEFEFSTLTNKEMIQFGLDVGFGERNSLGFGFMNMLK